jgi:hypothetical protein
VISDKTAHLPLVSERDFIAVQAIHAAPTDGAPTLRAAAIDAVPPIAATSQRPVPDTALAGSSDAGVHVKGAEQWLRTSN